MGNILFLCKCINKRTIRSSSYNNKKKNIYSDDKNKKPRTHTITQTYSYLYDCDSTQFDTLMDSMFEDIENTVNIQESKGESVEQEHIQLITKLKYI